MGTDPHLCAGPQYIRPEPEGLRITPHKDRQDPNSVKSSSTTVTGVFVTRNRLLEVPAEGGKLATAETQPVGLEKGGCRPAGELKAGDRIWRWVGAERRAVAVLEVAPAACEAVVVNLVLGEPPTFIAGDFLVRSKPPAQVP
jgi:hypothetical protein